MSRCETCARAGVDCPIYPQDTNDCYGYRAKSFRLAISKSELDMVDAGIRMDQHLISRMAEQILDIQEAMDWYLECRELPVPLKACARDEAEASSIRALQALKRETRVRP